LHGVAIKRVTIVAPRNAISLQKICVEAGDIGFQAGIAALFVIGSETTGAQAAFIHHNAVICPQGHALIAMGLGAMSIADNTLMSRGILSQPDLPILAQRQAASINALIRLTGCVLIYNLGQPRDRVPSFGASINTHFETARFNATTFIAPLQLPDGRVLFNDNQVTLQDFGVRGRLVRSVPLVIMSADDVSVQDNQINAEIPLAMLLVDALVAGATVRASGNRITEVPMRALLSCLSNGQRNITTENQTTHCIAALGSQVIQAANQQLIAALCEQLTALFGGK